MNGWRKINAKLSRAARLTVMLPPSGFADDYDLRPDGPVEIGIREPSSDTLDTARAWAAKKATRRHPGVGSEDPQWYDAFREALMQWIVARCTCKPDDVMVPYWACAEDVVPIALSPSGLLRLFEECELLRMGIGVLSPELSSDGCAELGAKLITDRPFAALSVSQARYVRRLLARVAEVLNGGESPIDVEPSTI
jgi:hypothetical protein